MNYYIDLGFMGDIKFNDLLDLFFLAWFYWLANNFGLSGIIALSLILLMRLRK